MSIVSTVVIPTIITIIIIVGVFEKKDLFTIFCDGAKDGIKTVIKMFPALIGIFLAINMMRSSGVFDFIASKIETITNIFKIPREIVPLSFIKPISGSASMAVATDLMKQFGVDSKIGKLAGVIMSSSETTFYVIAIYLGAVNIRKGKKIIIPALIGDIVSICVAVILSNFLRMKLKFNAHLKLLRN